jgi:hypothetical protein
VLILAIIITIVYLKFYSVDHIQSQVTEAQSVINNARKEITRLDNAYKSLNSSITMLQTQMAYGVIMDTSPRGKLEVKKQSDTESSIISQSSHSPNKLPTQPVVKLPDDVVNAKVNAAIDQDIEEIIGDISQQPQITHTIIRRIKPVYVNNQTGPVIECCDEDDPCQQPDQDVKTPNKQQEIIHAKENDEDSVDCDIIEEDEEDMDESDEGGVESDEGGDEGGVESDEGDVESDEGDVESDEGDEVTVTDKIVRDDRERIIEEQNNVVIKKCIEEDKTTKGDSTKDNENEDENEKNPNKSNGDENACVGCNKNVEDEEDIEVDTDIAKDDEEDIEVDTDIAKDDEEDIEVDTDIAKDDEEDIEVDTDIAKDDNADADVDIDDDVDEADVGGNKCVNKDIVDMTKDNKDDEDVIVELDTIVKLDENDNVDLHVGGDENGNMVKTDVCDVCQFGETLGDNNGVHIDANKNILDNNDETVCVVDTPINNEKQSGDVQLPDQVSNITSVSGTQIAQIDVLASIGPIVPLINEIDCIVSESDGDNMPINVIDHPNVISKIDSVTVNAQNICPKPELTNIVDQSEAQNVKSRLKRKITLNFRK